MKLERISEENIIDTTLPQSMEIYKRNLEKLIEQTKKTGIVDKFVIIRNDDFFPENYEWKVNSKNTNGEYRTFIRYIKQSQENEQKRSFFNTIFNKKVEQAPEPAVYENLMLYYPAEFRSTKHFTVNTPLEMTGEYNLVNPNRKFTIIDNIDNFLDSGYGYSLSEKDAYLDVTHEPLKISNNAIILISVDTYNEIKEDKEFLLTLSKRKLIIYKGSLSLAINMLLVENGVLPFRSEYKYDDELKEIINNSLKTVCRNYNLEYNRAHGMSSNGHFTNYIDQYEDSSKQLIKDFITYINSSIGSNLIEIERIWRYGKTAWIEYIDEIGLERFKVLLNEFNINEQNKLVERKEHYLKERESITPETSALFKETVQLIRKHEQEINFISDYNQLTKTVLKFYLSSDFEEQKEAAVELNNYFKNYNEEKVI